MPSPEKVAEVAANNLVMMFRKMRVLEDITSRDRDEWPQILVGDSRTRYAVHADAGPRVEKALEVIEELGVPYPRERLRHHLEGLVVNEHEKGTPIEQVHAALSQQVLNIVRGFTTLKKWEVTIAVRGVVADAATRIGRVEFRKMDAALYESSGNRFSLNGARTKAWQDIAGEMMGQIVAVVPVDACDADHAMTLAEQFVGESMDLLRYGQIAFGLPDEPRPQIGMSRLPLEGPSDHQSFVLGVGHWATTGHVVYNGSYGADADSCRLVSAWNELDALLKADPSARTEIQNRVILALSWMGNAALAHSSAVRLAAMFTALETMLLGDSETLGKRRKLATRIAAFPQLQDVTAHIGSADIDRLYRVRSECLHGGANSVLERDVRETHIAVAQTLHGLLADARFRDLPDLQSVLAIIDPKAPENMADREITVRIGVDDVKTIIRVLRERSATETRPEDHPYDGIAGQLERLFENSDPDKPEA